MSVTTSGLTAVRAGLLDYQAAWDEQRRLHEAVVAGEQGDTVLLLEHPSVYTAGKRTEPWDRPMLELAAHRLERFGDLFILARPPR